MKYDVIVKNARIPQGDDTIVTNILVKDEKIAGFLTDIEGVEFDKTIDAEGHLTIPGCFDSHTHFMDPGFTHRENFLTGSSSAAAGGLTMIMDMPCCSKPSVRSIPELESKINNIKEKAIIDFALWGGVTGEDVREGKKHIVQDQADYGVCAFKAYMTPSVPTYERVTDPEMLEAFRWVAETGLPVGIHAENYAMCDFYVKKFQAEGRMDGPAWAEARLVEAEQAAIELGINFAESAGARLHIVHMSSGIGAKLVGAAKKRGLDVTSETCPHYLMLNYQDAMTEHGAFAKIAPPLRTTKDNKELWEGLQNGSVDFMGTDHAPYEIETEKDAEGMNIWTAFPGIPGVETLVPIMVSEGYNKGRLSLSKLVDVLSTNAAKQYGLYPKKGAMHIGSDADFTIIDLEREWTIDQKKTYSMAKYNPLHGIKLKGKPVKTVVRGTVVYDDAIGIVGKEGFGQFVKRQNIQKLDRVIKY
ncbi:dihydroorotase, multifunctional complex type [Alkaliphilus metalliredigens QYMF]|uniref:Dihydroorotase, multifunctional complex type n=1 Tax=Alkaliphilus metalliredigens (strain QYMF) TaxID=293826 RepID=A6TWT7_ALKMQ|nr:dihydroorotase [Alkaliphilus metalliredigens]ABR50655.1 dihydroorotase, multifunctional complex type [Alkaliphilus metalliredigens QYMF]